MNQTQNGVVAGNDHPVKNTHKQGRNFTPNQLKNAVCRSRCGIIRIGASYTIKAADLPDREAFSCPEFMVLDVGRVYPQGWPHRFGGVTKPHVHSLDLVSQRMVFEVPKGIKAMNQTTTPTSGTTTHDHHQAALVLRATTHLSEALYQLRSSSGTTPTRKAMGLAYAAGRALSQVVGGAV